MVVKTDLRWQLLLAVAGLALVWSILAAQVPPATPTLPDPIAAVTADPGVCLITEPAPGGVLIEGVLGAPLYPNPLLATGNPIDEMVVDLVFDGLVRLDGRGLPRPALAREWAVSEDGLTWRFTLRDDVRWHDGVPFSAADVVFTYQLLQNPALPGGPDPLWQAVQVRAVDATTVELTLNEPYAPLPAATARGIVPAHVLAGVAPEQLTATAFNNRPIGSGPWRVAGDWVRNGSLRLEPNPEAWGDRLPAVEALEWRFYATEDELVAAVALGEVQTLPVVTAALLPRIAAVPGMRLFTSTTTRYTQLVFNLSNRGNAALRDLDVRQALAYGLDRPALVQAAVNGQGVVFDGPFAPGSWAHNPAATSYPADPAAADRLLDTAGWTRADGAAVRSRLDDNLASVPLQMRLLSTNQPYQAVLGRAIQAQWGALGIDVAITAVTPGDYRDRLEARDFDVAIMEVRPTADPDLYSFWSQEAIISGQNYAAWNDRRASEALEAARQTWDTAARLGYYDSFTRRFDAALPALPLFQHVQTYAVSAGVQGISIGRLTAPRERYATIADWTVRTRQIAAPCGQ